MGGKLSGGVEQGDRRADFPLLAQARSLWSEGDRAAALAHFEEAVARQPGNLRALIEAGRAHGLACEYDRAEALIEAAVAVGRDDPTALALVGRSMADIHREERARAILSQIANPTPAVRVQRARLDERAGRLDMALAELDHAIAAFPKSPELRLARARICRRMGRAATARDALVPLRQAGTPDRVRAEALAELCALEAAAGNAEGAVASISAAHAILRNLPEMPALRTRARANDVAIGELQLVPGPSLPPGRGRIAHLIGFPRSGTTLLEQMLAAHPDVVAASERPVFTQAILPLLLHAGRGRLRTRTLERIPANSIAHAKALYLRMLAESTGRVVGDRLLLDKNPNHTGILPALWRLAPDAKIVVALRDPRDVIVSCMTRLFHLTEFSAGLMNWGEACNLYAVEMGAWLRHRAALPNGAWIELRYEDLVRDPSRQVARVLDHLCLPWQDDVMRYRERIATGPIASPSQTEVRRPIHLGAIGRWPTYERWLAPHMDCLAPFVSAFGYDLSSLPNGAPPAGR